MDSRDIGLSETLIEGFNTAQAFHIGLLAGFRMNDAEQEKSYKLQGQPRHPYLWLVKS